MVYDRYLSKSLKFGKRLFKPDYLPMTDLAIVPFRSRRADGREDSAINLQNWSVWEELFEEQITRRSVIMISAAKNLPSALYGV
jgi:hypothetical protein